MPKSKYVIVGACAAGIGAVEAIREVDKKGEITVICLKSLPYVASDARGNRFKHIAI